ncbi:hypothetical protein PITCH_A90001 [uncultured Desulfobacterium sp.]|uniref:Uncharacterized protein n=1 Tax=uncultured Desulfobacterium sp. TaxID=201089 RepID=A0A445N3T2_9BACT|nr:hypothetical protein PITCH_A90001 [uncultured Desulfobacterium sp.]
MILINIIQKIGFLRLKTSFSKAKFRKGIGYVPQNINCSSETECNDNGKRDN